MNLADKLEFKKDVLLSVGVKVEEALERAEQQIYEARGGKIALREQGKNLLAIMAATDQEVEKSIPDLETLKIVKTWMSRMVIATENAANHLENIEIQARGEKAAHERTHDVLKKMVEEADYRITEIKKAVESGAATETPDGMVRAVSSDRRARPAGVHPGQTIKEQRLAEEAAMQAAATPVEEPKKKKTPRRKKTTRRKKSEA